MTPQEYIDGLQMAVRDFDTIADEAIRAVGIDFFKLKYRDAYNQGETIKGNNFQGGRWYASGKQYRKDFIWGGHYDMLNLSNTQGNKTSFRQSMYFDGEGANLRMANNATYKGEEYGSKVIANMYDNGIDVLEYENKDEADKQLFLKEFINRIFMGDLPF